ncbi:hypothetical protein J1N35_037351, partial [Gossypium stocksii]
MPQASPFCFHPLNSYNLEDIINPNIVVDTPTSVDATASIPIVHPSTNVEHVVVVVAPTLMMPPFSYAKPFLEIYKQIELWVHVNKLLEDLKAQNISLLEEFVAGNLLIEKFLPS